MIDLLSRLVTAKTGDTSTPGFPQPLTTTAYEYDPAGNRTRMLSLAGETRYDYQELISPTLGAFANRGNLVKLTNPQGEIFTLTYDPLSRRTKLTRPNNTESQYQYNPRSELLELKHLISSSQAILSRFLYTYDDTGNRKTKQDALGLHTFTYDPLNRLTQSQAPNPESYTYDGVGNRTTSHLSPTHLYDASNRLLEDNTFLYRYDLNGNLIEREQKGTGQIRRFTYDPENQLIRIDFPDSTFSRYAYDALGRRIQKRNPQSQITLFIYDTEDVSLEFNQLHQLQRHYTHGPGIDEPLSLRDLNTNQSFFYHPDGLGSVTALTNSTASIAQSYVYDSFGNIVHQQGILSNPYTFTSREFDPESGLYYFRARYYDPRMGRFIQEDPVSIFDSNEKDDKQRNLYAFVENNPINFADPSGTGKISALVKLGNKVKGIIAELFTGVRPDKHAGFVEGLKKVKDSSLRKTIKSLEKQMIRHQAKPPSKHHADEIRTFEEQIRLTRREVARRKQSGPVGSWGHPGAGVCLLPVDQGTKGDSIGGEIVDLIADFLGFPVKEAE